MSRRSSSTHSRSRTRPVSELPSTPTTREPVATRLVRQIFRLPRAVRIVAAVVFALAVTFTISPVLDAIYLRYFYSESTRIVPSLLATAAGLVMYVLGWVLTVGTVHEPLPERAVVLGYGLLGLLAVTLVIIMLGAGWSLGNTPTM